MTHLMKAVGRRRLWQRTALRMCGQLGPGACVQLSSPSPPSPPSSSPPTSPLLQPSLPSPPPPSSSPSSPPSSPIYFLKCLNFFSFVQFFTQAYSLLFYFGVWYITFQFLQLFSFFKFVRTNHGQGRPGFWAFGH